MKSYLKNQYEPSLDYVDLKTTFDNYFSDDVWLSEFKHTREFEKQLSLLVGVKHTHMTNNGTVSLSLALLAAGIKPGDEVLVPDLTMVATYNAVKLIGAKPVLVDIEEDTLCMDLDKAVKHITKNTKAFIYVSFNGRYSNIDKVMDFAYIHNLVFIEDAAQALSSRYSSKEYIGSLGDISSFSFSVPKIITTGQGGCVMTNKDSLSINLKRLRDFGREQGGTNDHTYFGINSKFTDMQALVGLSELKHIENRSVKKKQIYSEYYYQLKDLFVEGTIKFIETDLRYTVPWFVDIYVENRIGLSNYLKHNGIATRPVYTALHKLKYINKKGDFPVANYHGGRGLWLPCSLNITTNEIKKVCDIIKEYYE